MIILQCERCCKIKESLFPKNNILEEGEICGLLSGKKQIYNYIVKLEEYMKKILVIGSLNMDYSIELERRPKLGETVKAEKYIKSEGRERC